jgi:hypothetical protein
MVACAGPRNKNMQTNAKIIPLYFGVDEWKAEDVSVSVLFGVSSPWQNGPGASYVVLDFAHSAQSPISCAESQYSQHWYSLTSAEPQQRWATVRLVCTPQTRLLLPMGRTGVPRMPEQFNPSPLETGHIIWASVYVVMMDSLSDLRRVVSDIRCVFKPETAYPLASGRPSYIRYAAQHRPLTCK